ncbi:MAG TPA: kinase/pyrophosphorylase [Thiotrichaceae bacterium]|jgi:regulator of PEP synthase PpsR (kinase-PPPase family)|nr:kinase/pyrophosphorylase [Thiotrichaceae bacterium]HIM08059.1 kinase/pyrophosphorylase [Gammaproteobacteria bacterium]
MKRNVFFISDGTAITAETIGRTLLSQFESDDFEQTTIPFVRTLDKLSPVIELINRAAEEGLRPLVFSTLTDRNLSIKLKKSNSLVLDLFNVFINPLEAELGTHSTHIAGRTHGIIDKNIYDKRMEAMNFTLTHDDGASVQQLKNAQIILIGVSRSGKTPVCVFLAMQFGMRAANYPLTDDDIGSARLPKILHAHREKLYGLIIDPDRLQQIRQKRKADSTYASIRQCRNEIHDIEEMYQFERIPYLDVTDSSVEEIASKIIQDKGLKR